MITLYTTPPLWGLASISPACMKLETWLRMAGLKYEAVVSYPMSDAPKGKIPFIDYQGQRIGDSTLIIEHLGSAEGKDLDEGLSPEQRAISLAFRRLLKENVYWAIIQIRYNVEENWALYRQVLAQAVGPGTPEEQWGPIVDQIGEGTRAQMQGHGMMRHTPDEIVAINRADFKALSDFLGDKPFFMGDQPTVLDATAYAYIGNVIKPPMTNGLTEYAKTLDNLHRHFDRMTERYYGDDGKS